MAGAKWANHLVAPQDNELILINLYIFQSNQSIQYTLHVDCILSSENTIGSSIFRAGYGFGTMIETNNYGYNKTTSVILTN